jgi:phenylacetate-CoA ligase
MLATPEIIKEVAQHTRLESLVPAWQEVPMYRGYPFGRLVCPITPGGTGFDELPFISKPEMIRGFPANFLASGESLERLQERNVIELEYTSGTTGDQLPVMFRRGWWDRQEERALRLNPFVARLLDQQPDARRATLTTPACNGRVCFSAWRSRTHRTLGNTLYANQSRIPFVLTETDLARMAAEIVEWDPQFLDVDPVHGAWFALYCERQGLRFPSLKFVLCSYEFVSVVHRRILERVFGVPVFNLYGSTETGHLLMENAGGDMKPCLDNAFLEVIEPDNHGVGELAVTTLTNDMMPLLRYRIGDLVERQEDPYGTAYIVHGRKSDVLRDKDGELVTTWQVDQCFAGIAGPASYQLQQTNGGACRLRYVRENAGMIARDLSHLRQRLEELLQPPVEIGIEEVRMLPPTPSGKFRLTSRVD